MYIITTPIPYTNGSPHLGHLLEALYTDTIARYQRVQLDQENVTLTMGLDQHGLKIFQNAESKAQKVEDYVDNISKEFLVLWQEFDITYTEFVPTSSQKHRLVAQALFRSLQKKGYIYKKNYNGLYCVGCEDFYAPTQLTKEGHCPIHLTLPIVMEESNYFFRLSVFESDIIRFLENTNINPEKIKNEWYSFVKQGLVDVSCSREKARLSWGIDVPDDNNQVMYVWIEALFNYCTAMFGDNYSNTDLTNLDDSEILRLIQSSFPVDLLYCSKEISKFHLVIFPALLMALEIPLPKLCVVHGLINDSKGIKMSKSLGNGVYPRELVEIFGIEGTRFVFLHEVNIFGDSSLDIDKLIENYNTYLANNLGNLFTRVTTLVERYDCNFGVDIIDYNWSNYHDNMKNGDTKLAFDEIFKACSIANEYIEEAKPWQLAKENKDEELQNILGSLVNHLKTIAINLSPFLPQTSKTIQEHFNNSKITKLSPIFVRIIKEINNN